jgi:hypothetical protein
MKLGINQAAVSKRQKRAQFHLVMEMERYFRNKIKTSTHDHFFVKLLLAHLLGDFLLQPTLWVLDKEKKHKSKYLYIHTFYTE